MEQEGSNGETHLIPGSSSVMGCPGQRLEPPTSILLKGFLEEAVNLLEFSFIFQSIQEGFLEGSHANWRKQVLLFGIELNMPIHVLRWNLFGPFPPTECHGPRSLVREFSRCQGRGPHLNLGLRRVERAGQSGSHLPRYHLSLRHGSPSRFFGGHFHREKATRLGYSSKFTQYYFIQQSTVYYLLACKVPYSQVPRIRTVNIFQEPTIREILFHLTTEEDWSGAECGKQGEKWYWVLDEIGKWAMTTMFITS